VLDSVFYTEDWEIAEKILYFYRFRSGVAYLSTSVSNSGRIWQRQK